MEYRHIEPEVVQFGHIHQTYMDATLKLVEHQIAKAGGAAFDATEMPPGYHKQLDDELAKAQARVAELAALLGDKAPDTAERDKSQLHQWAEQFEGEHAAMTTRAAHPDLFFPIVVAGPNGAPMPLDVAEHAASAIRSLDAKHAWIVRRLEEMGDRFPNDPDGTEPSAAEDGAAGDTEGAAPRLGRAGGGEPAV